MTILLLPFQFGFYFSLLNAVANTLSTMLNKSFEQGHAYIFPGLRERAFSFSPLRVILVVGFSYISYIMLRLGSLSGEDTVSQQCMSFFMYPLNCSISFLLEHLVHLHLK